MGIHLRVLGESYPMNTSMTRFKWFSKSLRSWSLDESSLSTVNPLLCILVVKEAPSFFYPSALNPSNAKAMFIHRTKTNIFENDLNSVMLVFVG